MRKGLLILLGALLLLTPASAQVVLLEEHFEGDFPPDEWKAFGWERNDTAEPNYAGSGYCAIANGTEHDFSTKPAILSTLVNLTGYTGAELEFNMSYVHGSGEAILSITSLLTGKKIIEKKWTSNETGKVTIDLTPCCEGSIILAWEYKGQGGYWEIDDVKVTAETAAIPEFPGFALVLAVLASILGVLLRR